MQKPVCNLYDNSNYVNHITYLKQALDHRIILTKKHNVILFNQQSCLKEYIYMNAELRQ